MFIKTFGLFWRRDEVDWNPGIGHTFHLLGRNRDKNPGLWLADFQLIRAMGLAENINTTGFTNAVEWYQVKIGEEDWFLSRCE